MLNNVAEITYFEAAIVLDEMKRAVLSSPESRSYDKSSYAMEVKIKALEKAIEACEKMGEWYCRNGTFEVNE